MVRVALALATAAGTLLVAGGPAASHVPPADYHGGDPPPGYGPPPSPSPSPSPASPSTPAGGKALVATVGPSDNISLRTKAGKRVRTLRAGRYTVTVRDRADSHNFRLRGPGLSRATGVSFVGTRTWTVRFRKGKTYRFGCDPHISYMRGSFRAT